MPLCLSLGLGVGYGYGAKLTLVIFWPQFAKNEPITDLTTLTAIWHENAQPLITQDIHASINV